MDFGFNGNQSVTSASSSSDKENGNSEVVTDLDTGKEGTTNEGKPADSLDDSNNDNHDDNNQPIDNHDDDSNKETLEEGTVIEANGQKYTVDSNGNLLDESGNIFKESKDVDDWIKTFDKVDEEKDDKSISIDSIQKAIGVEIVGEDDKPVEFENSIEGIKAYVQAVNETARNEHYETAINSLYQRYPIIQDVLNYYIANGNSLEGFNEIKDRSGVTIDESNEAQQEQIIRMAWDEQGRRGDVNGYIQYLKSSGTLLATAKEELAGLQEADAQYKKELEEEAEKNENQRIEDLKNYWNGVNEVIKSRKIAGYQIPDNIIINKNGQKLSVTPDDFFNYIYRVDENGNSAYQKELAQQSFEERRDDEILRAYLKFTGGNYSNLVDMAINKKMVNTLHLKAKQRNAANTIKVTAPKKSTSPKTIDYGYN